MQNMNLSMTPYTQAGNFVCSQYDVGRQCQIQLVDENGAYTIPSGATVTVMATKPSGLGFSVDCTWSGSTVTFTTTNTMTNEFGRFPAELRITSGSTLLGTTNFWFKVERSPHPDEVIDSDVIIQRNLVARVTTLEEKMTSVESDITDLKADIGDLEDLETTDKSSLVNAINEARGSGGDGLTADIKTALLQIAQKVVYIDDDGQDYYDALYDALYAITAITLNTNSISLQSIGATSQLTATTTPAGGNVAWSSSNASVATVSATGLVTSVAYGSATITASAGSVSATCSVTVAQATLTSISAVYTQSGTVYDTDSLDSLKDDLVVTATWSNQTTSVVPSADYTLSGTLTEGTSTITVAYGGKTTTFNVTVTHYVRTYVTNGLVHHWDAINNTGNGHDANATTWADLVGSLNLVQVLDGVWSDDSLDFTPTTVGTKQNWISDGALTLSDNNMTIEMCLEPTSGASGGDFDGSRAAVVGYFYGFAGNEWRAISFSKGDVSIGGFANETNSFAPTGLNSLLEINSISATYTDASSVNTLYANGVQKTKGVNHTFSNGSTGGVIHIGGYGTYGGSTTYPYHGKIHAIRIYDRVLTADEIANNYAVDVDRFGLE